MDTVDAAGLPIGDDHPPRIMSVLNVSSESPYDPSVYADPGEAAAYVDEALIGEGADIVDVGLASANKRFDVLSAEEELERLETAVAVVEAVSGDAVFSIETRYHEVAEAALSAGFDMVNDVCGFADPDMPRVCTEYDAAVVKMASPPDLERPGAIADVDDIYDALRREGFTEKTIVDPAFGGWSEHKTLAEDRETFRRLREFRTLGRPILVSINRKNFLRELADRSSEAALAVSLAATSMAVERGAHVIRTHDVAETRDAALVGATFSREGVRDGALGVEALDVTNVDELARHFERVDPVPPDPAPGIAKAFSIRGLRSSDRAALADLADESSVVWAGDDEEVVVAGTLDALSELADPAGAPAELNRALARVRDACR